MLLLREEDTEKLQSGMTVTVNGNPHTLVEVTTQMTQVPADSLEAHYGGFQDGQWVCVAQLDGSEPEGIYGASILIESIAPMKFALN